MQNKSDIFAAELQELAGFAKVLSHPARIKILQELIDKSLGTCMEIVGELPLAQATVSQHLKVLKEAGIIEGQVDGPRVCYYINHQKIKQLRDTFLSLFDSSFNKCCQKENQ
ncbi:winged helix-turn-helix transcriptional regulator [Caldithrix abyssi]|nr:winged helix-turn-helix transcriptional regulator [Caldithrix abyssi]